MGRKWIDDQTTLSFVSLEILGQEDRIAQQRDLIAQLEVAGHRELAAEAREFLGDMCSTLSRMRRDERAEKIEMREQSFRPISEEEAMEHVMRACPL